MWNLLTSFMPVSCRKLSHGHSSSAFILRASEEKRKCHAFYPIYQPPYVLTESVRSSKIVIYVCLRSRRRVRSVSDVTPRLRTLVKKNHIDRNIKYNILYKVETLPTRSIKRKPTHLAQCNDTLRPSFFTIRDYARCTQSKARQFEFLFMN